MTPDEQTPGQENSRENGRENGGRRASGAVRFASRHRLLVGLVAGALVLAGVGSFWVLRQVNPPGGPGAPVDIVIAEGTSAITIAEMLEREDVISSARVFRVYIRVTRAGEFKAGSYTSGELRERMAMGDVVRALEAGPEIAFERLTVPEGFTLDQIADRVGSLEWLDGDRFMELATAGTIRSALQPDGVDTLEGLLFPDTYQVSEEEDERAVLGRMLALFDFVADEVELEARAAALGLTPYEAVVVASLIEREARVDEDRPLISAVIHNRLEQGMLLQIDATVLYALGEHRERVLFRDLEVDSPYNTYRHAGLPPTPIASPGRDALIAALEPARVEYLYYVKIDESGKHAFGQTLADHERNIAEARRRGVR